MKYWYLLFLAGALAVFGGIIALLNPLAATLAATKLAALMFILVGAITLFAAGGNISWGHRLWTVLLGILTIVLGVSILGNPLEGVLTLTLIVAVLFLVEGLIKIVLSFGARGTPYFWMLLLTGVVSLVLAVMILSNFPESAVAILGILLAVDLLSTGVSMMALSLHAKGGRAVASAV